MKVYNSQSREKEEFIPQTEGVVKMYVCGPTVYSLSHIGHARSAVAFDVIFRYLKFRGYDVHYARNYTDVDDKIINKANEEGLRSEEVAEQNIIAFDEDMAALGVELPTYRPKATETMDEIVVFIEKIIEKGYGYELDGDVYYSVRKFNGYGKLSGKNIDDLEHGARINVDDRKKDPLDFALWKASKPGEPSWPSPWGPGRPGWHIECSAMSVKFLGETLDIHGGGKDLIFPHHENEIAQSEAASEKPFVRYWMHNGFVNIDKEKMSKSVGNILNIRDALDEYSSEAIRLFLLSSHYRSPIDYSSDNLREAEAALERYYKTLERMEKGWPGISGVEIDPEREKSAMSSIIKALDDDFNTAVAIGEVFKEVNEANRVMDGAAAGETDTAAEELSVIKRLFERSSGILGIFTRTAADYFVEKKGSVEGISEAEIEGLIAERTAARANKDYKRGDEIRDELKAKGIILEDTAKGTGWTVG